MSPHQLPLLLPRKMQKHPAMRDFVPLQKCLEAIGTIEIMCMHIDQSGHDIQSTGINNFSGMSGINMFGNSASFFPLLTGHIENTIDFVFGINDMTAFNQQISMLGECND